MNDWKANSIFKGFEGSFVPTWMAEMLVDGGVEFRRRLLCFVTGSMNIPLGGFSVVSPPFTLVARPELSDEHLPASRTCLNCLYVPLYSSREHFERALQKALVALQM